MDLPLRLLVGLQCARIHRVIFTFWIFFLLVRICLEILLEWEVLEVKQLCIGMSAR